MPGCAALLLFLAVLPTGCDAGRIRKRGLNHKVSLRGVRQPHDSLLVYFTMSAPNKSSEKRNGLKTRLDKVLKERKSTFPLLVKGVSADLSSTLEAWGKWAMREDGTSPTCCGFSFQRGCCCCWTRSRRVQPEKFGPGVGTLPQLEPPVVQVVLSNAKNQQSENTLPQIANRGGQNNNQTQVICSLIRFRWNRACVHLQESC
ncbi:unnamed protein product [Tetraodon nigroviridis]|uniref:(spotted green pufferfish) hypothetical protein n=1 Tax=Tetraodon nigroviridis TaxID=99883 RepID=Q4SKF3_TETNG|nr:unnamed protein product [Tetraodon nigroviridis]